MPVRRARLRAIRHAGFFQSVRTVARVSMPSTHTFVVHRAAGVTVVATNYRFLVQRVERTYKIC
jgi:hypothetical protein